LKEPYRSYLNEAAVPVFQGGAASKANVEGECFPPQRKLKKKKDLLSEKLSGEFQVFPEIRS